ncbi:methylated-DNA--[protein]-cysteine S-methyltransferase [Vaginisenegalia massiliensis]|uniref:methylated-DNA--[protein]-cysteine S-methyltransferase n=1 Tax=Vaginisenegalia massiliensis TaxID=2058294 RepID=UPI0019D1BB92|nr:methylated-DNA--[protein]-cysteine S-methyltransferase [Vaginisenegalia massiliensis]
MDISYDLVEVNKQIKFPVMVHEGRCCYVGPLGETLEQAIAFLENHKVKANYRHNPHEVNLFASQLAKYFTTGQAIDYSQFPVDFLYGTPWQHSIWHYLQSIPLGETRSYSQVAQATGRPRATRAVGTAIGLNPISFVVPCHRVINKNGRLGGYRGGLNLKQSLLIHEQNSTVGLISFT